MATTEKYDTFAHTRGTLPKMPYSSVKKSMNQNSQFRGDLDPSIPEPINP